MPGIVQWLAIATFVSLAASASVVVRLLWERLHRRYWWLFWLFVEETLRAFVLVATPMRRALYGWVYVLSSPIVWVLTLLAVLELYRLLFDDYPGIASAARIFVGVSILCAAGVALALFFLSPGAPEGVVLLLQVVKGMNRTVYLAVFLFLALMQLFLMRFPVPHRPNLTVCTIGCTLYFGSGAGVMLIMAAAPGSRTGRILELSLLLFSNLVLFVWAASLKRSGEGLHIPKRPLAPGEPEAIREQLEAFGGILGRAGRIFHNKID